MELNSQNLQREFMMTDADFKIISDLAYEFTGIVLGPQKRDMVYGRLARRLRDLGLTRVSDYINAVKSDQNEEVSKFINAITTNLTSFYREQHHFDFITKSLIPELKKTNLGTKKIRAWSAGCSTGEEPYSIAITFKESMDLQGWDLKILATDLDSKVLNKGQQGIYDIDRIESIKSNYKQKWFLKDQNHPDIVKVKPEIQELIKFKRLNLLEKWPMKGPFDFIFCRNVVIYFNAETQAVLFDRYAEMLKDGGYLIIGHSESLDRTNNRFRSIGKTIYKKIS
ncbi:MAG: chemotaxis protein methyltransferase CheR [Oleiphilaceae bacterium]